MHKVNLSAEAFIRTLPGSNSVFFYKDSSNVIICKLRLQRFDYSDHNLIFHIHKHCDSEKNKWQGNLNGKRLQVIDYLFEELSKALIEANISFNKLENKVFNTSLEKCLEKSIPDESTLRKLHLPDTYRSVVSEIQTKVCDKNSCFQVDEATDSAGRFMVAVLIGTLDSSGHPSLVELKEVSKADHVAINQILSKFFRLVQTRCNEKLPEFLELQIELTEMLLGQITSSLLSTYIQYIYNINPLLHIYTKFKTWNDKFSNHIFLRTGFFCLTSYLILIF